MRFLGHDAKPPEVIPQMPVERPHSPIAELKDAQAETSRVTYETFLAVSRSEAIKTARKLAPEKGARPEDVFTRDAEMQVEYNSEVTCDDTGYRIVYRVNYGPNRWINIIVTSHRQLFDAREYKWLGEWATNDRQWEKITLEGIRKGVRK